MYRHRITFRFLAPAQNCFRRPAEMLLMTEHSIAAALSRRLGAAALAEASGVDVEELAELFEERPLVRSHLRRETKHRRETPKPLFVSSQKQRRVAAGTSRD